MRDRPFLTIVTRHMLSRPQMFAACLASIAAQTDQDYQHLILLDDLPGGRGLQWANAQFAEHAGEVLGEYVLMLDDDDALIDVDAVSALKETARAECPDVIVFKGDHGWRLGILPHPAIWGTRELIHAHISGQDFALRREVWQRHIKAFARPEAGDWAFVTALWRCGYQVTWLDRLLVRAGHNFGEAGQ